MLEQSDISDEEVDLSETNHNVSIQNNFLPQPNTSDNQEDFEFSSEDQIVISVLNPSSQQRARNGVIWNQLLRPRPGQANAANVFRLKTGVHPAIRSRAAASAYDCWKLYVDNSMLKSIQEHTCRKAIKIVLILL